jgi:hypothetical protein
LVIREAYNRFFAAEAGAIPLPGAQLGFTYPRVFVYNVDIAALF